MINLLPPELKLEYHYARRNTSLVRYVILLGIGVIGLAVVSATGLFYLQQSSKNYLAQAAVTEQSLKVQKQAQTEKEVQDMSNSLKLAVQVLSKEVLFSKLLQQLAVITPANASLSNLSISQVQGSVDITAKTADYGAATQLQVNLADPANKIFAKADIVSITCAAPTGAPGKSQYPCTAVIRALFASNNPFLFINNKAGS